MMVEMSSQMMIVEMSSWVVYGTEHRKKKEIKTLMIRNEEKIMNQTVLKELRT